MTNIFSRTEALIGKQAVEKLKMKKVAIFGIGGVGSYVLEGLVRAGIWNFILVDNDIVDETNLNRQIIATVKTIGQDKVEVAKNRALEINPNVSVEIYKEFFNADTKEILNQTIDYVVDSIDTVSSKIELIMQAKSLNVPIISCMGTGNKLDPTRFKVADIYKTEGCPLAKVMRKELKRRNISNLKTVYSKEEPVKLQNDKEILDEKKNKKTPGSISFVPSVAGLIIAGEVVNDILKNS